MEFILNKIDTVLRQKINDGTKEGMVHGYKNISIYKDKEHQDPMKKEFKFKKQELKKIVIEASKTEVLKVEAYKEDLCEDDNGRGILIDEKR